jgi:diguanylate cyclase (GGDEF)-like protein
VLAALALDEVLGVISQPWPQVSQMVRRAAFDLVADIADAIIAGMDHQGEDRMTTLVSKPLFHIALEHELNRARRRLQPLSIILLEISNLPQIIAEYGYSVGDRVLERLAILVRRFFRHYDWVARHGAHSIVIMLPETGVQGAMDLAVRVRETIEQRLVFSDLRPQARARVTLSATAVGTEPVEAEQDAATVLAAAEQGLRRAKAAESRRVERVRLTSSGVTILDVAAALECTPFMVRQLVREGHLTTERRGRHVYIHRVSLDRYRDAARPA